MNAPCPAASKPAQASRRRNEGGPTKMKRLILMLLISGMMQLPAGKACPVHQQATTQNQQGTAGQSAEMAEASRLTASVMKLYQEGKYDDALPLAKRVLQKSDRLRKANDESITLALINIGEIQFARGRADDATKLFERAL